MLSIFRCEFEFAQSWCVKTLKLLRKCLFLHFAAGAAALVVCVYIYSDMYISMYKNCSGFVHKNDRKICDVIAVIA